MCYNIFCVLMLGIGVLGLNFECYVQTFRTLGTYVFESHFLNHLPLYGNEMRFFTAFFSMVVHLSSINPKRMKNIPVISFISGRCFKKPEERV